MADMWQPASLTIIGIALISVLLVFKLGTLTSGLSPKEFTIQQQVQKRSIQAETILTKDTFFLPYKSVLYAFEKIGLSHPTLLRGISAFVGLVAVVSFFLVIRNWHTSRVALLTTFMFASSTWFLHHVRFIGPDALYLLVSTLILCAIWLHRDTVPKFAAVCSVFLVVTLFYVPGMIWLIAPGLLWQHKLLWRQLQEREAWVLGLVIFVGIGLLIPLILSLMNDPRLFKTLLGLPQDLPTIKEFSINLSRVPWQLIARAPVNPEFNLGRLPIIDVFTASMVLLGAYSYFYRRQLDRVKLIVGLLFFGVILIALGGPVPSLILLPVIYFLVAGGITLMLQRWFTVFPRNPLARNIGVSLVIVTVAISCLYNLQRYFIAWPNSPVTRATFSKQPE